MLKSKLLIALPAVALLAASVPQSADARTKDIVKYGAIGLGALAVGSYLNQSNYGYSQPYYGGYYGYSQPYYGGYYNSYPSYGYSYGYSQPYYGGYYGYGY